MFNLEEKITEWRKQMLAAGIQSPVPLEELENHLREEIERQVQSGLNAHEAFEVSAQLIGRAGKINNEFQKAGKAKAKKQQSIIVLVGCFIMGFIYLFDAAVRWQRQEIISIGWWSLQFFGAIGMIVGSTHDIIRTIEQRRSNGV